MMESGSFLAGQRRLHWVLLEVVEGLFEILNQQRTQIPADAVADEDALYHEILMHGKHADRPMGFRYTSAGYQDKCARHTYLRACRTSFHKNR